MIYIDENSTLLVIPRIYKLTASTIIIKDALRDSSTRILLSNVETTNYFYKIDILGWDFKFNNGSQYEYYLYASDDTLVLSSGIIQCGDYIDSKHIQYDVDEKNYKQYNR